MFKESITRAENNTYETFSISWSFNHGNCKYEGVVALTTIEDTAMASGIAKADGDRITAYGNGRGRGYRYAAVGNMRHMFSAKGIDMNTIIAEQACDRLLKLIDRN